MLGHAECITSTRISIASFNPIPTFFQIAMDRVPIRFIQEVLRHLEDEEFTGIQFRGSNQGSRYPSTWGRVAQRKTTREEARLIVYLAPNKEAVFSVRSGTFFGDVGDPVAVEDLPKFDIKRIYIRKKNEHFAGGPAYHPLTKKTLQVLSGILRRGHPCRLGLYANFKGAPLVEQLCLAPSQIASIFMCSRLSPPMEVLTRSIMRGTLRSFESSCKIRITKKLFSLVLLFVASQKFKYLRLAPLSGAISREAYFTGVIDAIVRRESKHKFTFYLGESHQDIYERLKVKDMRVSLVLSPNCRKTDASISRNVDGFCSL
uniref:Ribonucleoside-diphosphate reductase n=1 Tax=Steinernema glaseri TaxID=37863 RepID=A0A1I7Y7E6_9BILA